MNRTEKLAKETFSEQDLKELQRAIVETEKKTSGEVKLDFEYDVQHDPLHHATRIFHALQLHKTVERNATLIVLFLKDRKFAILGDKGIHRRVPPDFWDSISSQMEAQFRAAHFKQGLLLGIQEIGDKLAEYFPPRKGDRNEISDKIELGH
ncbi:MAG: TPM domain-containing protein [Acidobacteria bacterium]|nr:TPM domain-containing protein [Acidobacteriota bacterium]